MLAKNLVYINYGDTTRGRALPNDRKVTMSLRIGSERYGILKSTFFEKRQSKIISKNKNPQVSSTNDEKHLVNDIFNYSQFGFSTNCVNQIVEKLL